LGLDKVLIPSTLCEAHKPPFIENKATGFTKPLVLRLSRVARMLTSASFLSDSTMVKRF
jgi:hypothetical protein